MLLGSILEFIISIADEKYFLILNEPHASPQRPPLQTPNRRFFLVQAHLQEAGSLGADLRGGQALAESRAEEYSRPERRRTRGRLPEQGPARRSAGVAPDRSRHFGTKPPTQDCPYEGNKRLYYLNLSAFYNNKAFILEEYAVLDAGWSMTTRAAA